MNEAVAAIQEANASLELTNATLTQIFAYQENANRWMQLADRYRIEAIERRNEAFSIWNDPSQWKGQYVSLPTTQPYTQREQAQARY